MFIDSPNIYKRKDIVSFFNIQNLLVGLYMLFVFICQKDEKYIVTFLSFSRVTCT